jgi:predicted metal-dependent hydrolase
VTETLSPGSRHAIPVRRPDFPFDARIPRHWLGGNPLATQFFNGLNLVFPDGERFFIQAVRDHLGELDDPELERQVRGFFGQEGRHAHEHERYFEILEAQGYRIERFLRRFRRFARFTTRRLPRGLRLAMTAGAEHYTALFGALALEDRFLLDEAHPTMRALVVWHATEEIEHKSVAFDVFQATHGSYPLRVAGFALATLTLFGWTFFAVRMLLKQDQLSRRALARARAQLRDIDEGEAPRRVWRGIRDYLRRDFHPNDTDELPLAHRRLREVGLDPVPG